MMIQIAIVFVIKLTAGITQMWMLMPRRDVTDGFFRIQMRLVLGLAVLGAFLARNAGMSDPTASAQETADGEWWLRTLQIVAAVIAYPGSIFWALGRRLPGGISIWLLAIVCNGTLLLHSLTTRNQCPLLLQIASDFVSSGILGAMLTGMLLGHWYLTTPTMSIRPLWWFTRALLVLGGLRLVVSGLLVLTSGLPSLDMLFGLFFGLRLLCGIVVPVTVGLAVLKILEYRNTQSATGVLYAGLILIFMGEMMAELLEQGKQIPF